ncbi:MAG: heme biosynthesis protein HemY [Aestuariivita sp.]|nr:heme biosynthesis protein HemY [Aestuariivita sp.]
MLWSLVKILLFVVSVGVLAYGAGYLSESEGGLQLTVSGTEFSLDPLQSAIAITLLIFATWLFLKVLSLLMMVWRFMSGDETALSRFAARNREQKGTDALAESIIALVSGEGRLAMTKAVRASKLLDKPELTDLLMAQASELMGDTTAAQTSYKRLISMDKTRFVGIRGVMKYKLSDGDDETALQLAEKAFQINPKHQKNQDVLLKLQIQARDWAGARRTLNAQLKYGTLTRDVHTRRDCILAISEAQDKFESNPRSAQTLAIEANRKSPGLIPAAVLAARASAAKGKIKQATRVLRKAWEAQPHPDLAAAFADLAPEETPADRVRRFSILTQFHFRHIETCLVAAELNLAAEDVSAARKALEGATDDKADARVFTMMAAIEHEDGAADSRVKEWLTKAIAAPPGPQWVCSNCDSVQKTWAACCESCESFDTLSWIVPHASKISTSTGVEMLPLTVGKDAVEQRVVRKSIDDAIE